jgi:virginiamycin B lyase
VLDRVVIAETRMVRGLLGRRAGRLLAACVLTCTAACITAVSVAAFAPAAPAPASGAGSITRIRLGSAQMQAQCITSAPDGSVWILAHRNGPSALIHVDADGSVHPYTVPGPVALLAPPTQCLALGTDGRLWFFNNNQQVDSFDPATGRVQTFQPPTANSGLLAIATAPDGDIWFTETKPYRVGRISGGHVTEYTLPPGATAGGTSIAVMPDGTVWTNPWYTASATSWPTITELSAQGAVLHQFAIGPHGGAEDLEVGPSGLPWFSYGSTPWGVGEVEPGPIAKVHGWNYFYNPTTMVLGADGRMWMAWSQLNLPGLYGYYDTATQSATMFFMPSTSGGLFAMADGANGTIDITAQDSYLYVVQTGATTSLSTIATSLPTPAEAFASVAVVAAGAAISIGAILFITFPSQLFNLTFQENYAEIRELLQRRVKWALRPKKASETSRQSVADWVKFVAVVLVGALLGGLLDPHFGTSLGTLDTYVAIVLAIGLGATFPAIVTYQYHRLRHENRSWRLQALPLGLGVAAVCVLVSRLAQFEPGYLYGVICGVAFATRLTTTQKGHIVALCALTTLSIAVIAWLLWLPVTGIAQQPGAFAGVVILDDLLASIFVSGLVGSAIGLLPLRFLPGWDLRQWHQGVWLGCFGLAMFGVVEVLLIPHNDNHSNVPLITTLVLMVVFGGISVGLRELFARRLRRRSGRQAPATFRDHVRELLTPAASEPSAEHQD